MLLDFWLLLPIFGNKKELVTNSVTGLFDHYCLCYFSNKNFGRLLYPTYIILVINSITYSNG